ncbi:host specificity protein J [Pseudescherichia vulneris]
MTDKNIFLTGSKGGGSSHTPTEDPDSLKSRSYSRQVIAISEGEIGGLLNGSKSLYLNGVPLQNDDDSYNYQNVTWDFQPGTQGQPVLSIIEGAEDVQDVNIELKYNVPQVQEITDVNANSFTVSVKTSQMIQEDTDDGDIHGSSVSYKIEYMPSDTKNWIEAGSQTISGKTTSGYVRDASYALTGTGPWQIRVTRTTEDSASASVMNQTFWQTLGWKINDQYRYPNTAVIGISVDASQFDSVPTIAGEYRGLYISVPSNYDPDTRAYSGDWDGTFKQAVSDNPAWVLYDILINDRYGVGSVVGGDMVDKWGLYVIAQYCDELVDDGKGGQEPRFSCNLYLQDQQDAYQTISDICSIFRGMMYWGASGVMVTQDSPPPSTKYQFTNANVTNDGFVYHGSTRNTRYNAALVSWNDLTQMGNAVQEYVEYSDGIALDGAIRQVQVQAIGCTSQGQAHRLGKWAIYQSRMGEVVSFTTGMEANIPRPGDVIQIADAFRAGRRMGGRTGSNSTKSQIVLDSTVSITGGVNSYISVILPDGSLETRQINDVGEVQQVSPVSVFSDAPVPGSTFVIASDDLEPQLFRAVSVMESDDGGYDISGVTYNASSYPFIEDGEQLVIPDTSDISTVPEPVGNLTFAESFYLANPTTVKSKINVSWAASRNPMIRGYITSYRGPNNDNWITNPEITTASFDILDSVTGDYDVKVFEVNVVGVSGPITEQTYDAQASQMPPESLTGLSLTNLNSWALMSWDPVTDVAVKIGGYVRFRLCQDVNNISWQNGIAIGGDIPGNVTSAQLPLLAGVYMAKTVSCYGVESQEFVEVETDAAAINAMNAVETFKGEPWSGARNGLEIDSNCYLRLIVSEDGKHVETTSGTWVSDQVVDLGSVFTSRLTAEIGIAGQELGDTMDTWPDVDTRPDWDGTVTDATGKFYVRTTNQDPANEIWSDWNEFVVGDWQARAFQFGCQLLTQNDTHTPILYKFDVTIDMPDTTQSGYDVAIAAGGTHVTYPQPFNATPAVSVTAQNMVQGEQYKVTNRDRFGFDVQLLGADGTPFDGTIDWIAKGYGKQISE